VFYSIVSLDLPTLWANDKRRASTGTKADTSRSNPLNLRTGVSRNSCRVLHPHFHCLAALCVGCRLREVVTTSDTMKVIAHVVGGWWEQHICAFCLECVTRCNPVLWQDSFWRIVFSFLSLLSKIRHCFCQKRTALCWVIAQQIVVISYRRFGITYLSHLKGWRIKKWLIYTGCPRRNGQNFGRVFLMLNYTDI